MTVMAAHPWATNGDLVEAAASLGYLRKEDCAIDVTCNTQKFWSKWRPDHLLCVDIDPQYSFDGKSYDFRKLPFYTGCWDLVVCDPPYRFSGTSDYHYNVQYGMHTEMTWQDRLEMMLEAVTECARLLRQHGRLLYKCQDQVVSGHKVWQTIEITNRAAECGLRLIDKLDMLTNPRPQPDGRKQAHSRQNFSSLLVFKKR